MGEHEDNCDQKKVAQEASTEYGGNIFAPIASKNTINLQLSTLRAKNILPIITLIIFCNLVFFVRAVVKKQPC